MRLLASSIYGPGGTAALNATLLGIFEAVLVILLARALAPRSKFKETCERVARQINNLIFFGDLLAGELWDQYALDTDERVEDMRLRLEEVIDPEGKNREVAEDKKLEEFFRRDYERRTSDAELIKELKSKPVEEREGILRELEQDQGQERAAWIRERTERPTPRPNEWGSLTGGGARQPRKVASAFRPPEDEAERGMVLLKIIVALGTQSPFPCAIHESDNRIIPQDSAHVSLPDVSAVRQWLRAFDRVGDLISIIDVNDNTLDRLNSAARKINYGIKRGAASPIVARANQAMVESRSGIYPSAKAQFPTLWLLKEELENALSVWEANRPGRRGRLALAAGLVGGLIVFSLGVIYPLVVVNASPAAYLYVPLIFYLAVLILVVYFGIREVFRS